MDRTTILLLFGGESSEHDVSIASARNIFAAIDDEVYEVILGYIDREGKWWLLETLPMEINTHGAPQLLPALGTGGLVTLPGQRVIQPDVLFPVLHGQNGEDGSVQGLAALLHLPVVGCDMYASALCMNKISTKEVLAAHSIVTVPYEVHRRDDDTPEFHKISMMLGSPVFVKPARAGSSVGVSKVYSEDDFVSALARAHEHDEIVLIEQAVAARELEVAVIGTPPYHHASHVGEITPGADFYDYDDKYNDNSATITIPAELDRPMEHRIRALAARVYEALGCKGLARVDFFLGDDNALYVNEVNTLPGFTNLSMFPKLWRHEGMSYPQLVERLIENALGRATIKNIESKEE